MPRRYDGSEAAARLRPSARPCPRDAAATAGGHEDAAGAHRRRRPAALPRRRTCRRRGSGSRSPRNGRAADGSGRCAATAPAARRAWPARSSSRKWVSAFWPSSSSTCIISRSRAPGRLASGRSIAPSGLRRHADHDGPVELLGLTVAERLGQALGGLPGAGDQQQAAGILVEAMDQPRPLLEAEAQRVEHAVDVPLRAGPALHRQPRRLVEDDDVIVAMDHQATGSRRRPGRKRSEISPRLGRRRQGDAGRQADRLPGLDPVLALGPLAVDRGPGRCAAASAARRGSARESGAGTSDRGADRPRRRKRRASGPGHAGRRGCVAGGAVAHGAQPTGQAKQGPWNRCRSTR